MSRYVCHIGIDPSYTNYALVAHITVPPKDDNPFHAKAHQEVTFDFSPKKAGVRGYRLEYIHATLLRQFAFYDREYDVRTVVLEGYAPGAKFNREALGELGGITRLALQQVYGDGPVYVASPTGLKKFVTGRGNAPKDNVMLQVYKKWGVELGDNDLADAYGLMQIGRALTYGTPVQYEQEVIAAVTKDHAPPAPV